MSVKEKEKPITEADFDLLPDVGDKNKLAITPKMSLKERIAILVSKYQLNPLDMYLRPDTKNPTKDPTIVIRASGWYKIGQMEGWNGSETTLTKEDYVKGQFMFKVRVYKKGFDRAFETIGYCDRSESGHSGWENFAMLGHAETRGIVRGIRMMCPISGVKSEEDIDNIEAATIGKMEQQLQQTQAKIQEKAIPIKTNSPRPPTNIPSTNTTQIIKSNPNPAPLPIQQIMKDAPIPEAKPEPKPLVSNPDGKVRAPPKFGKPPTAEVVQPPEDEVFENPEDQ